VDFAAFTRRVGANVRRARWATGKTQIDLAAVLTPRLVGELERGAGNPTLHTLFLLAEELQVAVSDLVDVGPKAKLRSRERTLSAPKRGRKPKRVR